MGLASRLLSISLGELLHLVGRLYSRSETGPSGRAGTTTRPQVYLTNLRHIWDRQHFLMRGAGADPAAPAEGRQRHQQIGGLGTLLYGYAPAWVLMAVAQPPV
jgi:hypothetical protein